MQIESSKLLSGSQKAIFARARIATVAEVWLQAASEIARKTRVSVEEVQAAVDLLCKETAPRSLRVTTNGGNSHQDVQIASRLTTGDNDLDANLGGGIEARSITEIVGEAWVDYLALSYGGGIDPGFLSAAGKTQLALQLAAMSQISIDKGGLDGGVAYITTGSASLPTNRLLEIARLHQKTAKLDMNTLMDNIHHCRAPTVYALMQVLKYNLPSLCDQLSSEDGLPSRKPIRLLIVDSITALFQIGEKTTAATLADRSKGIAEISTALHHLVFQRGLTCLVLSHVTDVFQVQDGFYGGQEVGDEGEFLYREQSKWFNQSFGDGRKEATLGLIWANQVNTRVMLSRTERRRPLENEDSTTITVKRRKGVDGTQIPARFVHLDDPRDEDDDELTPRGTLIRRFSLIFSPSAQPTATDFTIVAAGVRAFDSLPLHFIQPRRSVPTPTTPLPTFVPSLSQLVHTEASHSTHAAPVQSSPRALRRATSLDGLSVFDEEEWIVIAEQSEVWDAPEPEVEELPSGDALNVDSSRGDVEDFIPSSQGEEVELASFNYPSNVALPNDLISSPIKS